jgi:hypothetical protein
MDDVTESKWYTFSSKSQNFVVERLALLLAGCDFQGSFRVMLKVS